MLAKDFCVSSFGYNTTRKLPRQLSQRKVRMTCQVATPREKSYQSKCWWVREKEKEQQQKDARNEMCNCNNRPLKPACCLQTRQHSVACDEWWPARQWAWAETPNQYQLMHTLLMFCFFPPVSCQIITKGTEIDSREGTLNTCYYLGNSIFVCLLVFWAQATVRGYIRAEYEF